MCILKMVISDSIITKQKLKFRYFKFREINAPRLCAHLLLLLLLLLNHLQKKKTHEKLESSLINSSSPNFLNGKYCRRKYLYYCSGTLEIVLNRFQLMI